MKATKILSFAASLAAPMAFVQEDTAPAPMDGEMMQGGGMLEYMLACRT